MQQPLPHPPLLEVLACQLLGQQGVPYLPIFSLHLGHICLHVEPNSLGLEHLEGTEGREKEEGRMILLAALPSSSHLPSRAAPRSSSSSQARGGPRRGFAEPWKSLSQVGTCAHQRKKGLHCSGTFPVAHHLPVAATIKESKL